MKIRCLSQSAVWIGSSLEFCVHGTEIQRSRTRFCHIADILGVIEDASTYLPKWRGRTSENVEETKTISSSQEIISILVARLKWFWDCGKSLLRHICRGIAISGQTCSTIFWIHAIHLPLYAKTGWSCLISEHMANKYVFACICMCVWSADQLMRVHMYM